MVRTNSVGGDVLDAPRSWKSNFTYEKSQRVLRRSPCEARVLHRFASIDCYNSLEFAGLPHQNFATLRMTYSRFAFFMAIHAVANYSFSRCLRFYENYRQNRVFAKQNGVVRRQAFCWARHSNFTYTPNYTRGVVVTRGAVQHNLRGSSGFSTH